MTVLAAGTGANAYFRFTVTDAMLDAAADGRLSAIFDIDAGYVPGDLQFWASLLTLYRLDTAVGADGVPSTSTSLVAQAPGFSDPAQGLLGSFSWFDDYLEFTFDEAGTYVIEVSDWINGAPPVGVDYVLNVSLENHPVAGFVFAPEPLGEDEGAQSGSGYQDIDAASNFFTFFDPTVGNTDLGGGIDFLAPYVRVSGTGNGTVDVFQF